MQQRRISLAEIRRRGTKVLNQGNLQTVRLLQPLSRVSVDSNMHEGGQRRVVACDSQPLQVVQGTPHAFGAQARDADQLVGGDAFVRVSIDQRLGDGEQLPAVDVGHGTAFELGARLLHRVHPKRRRKHLRPILLAGQQHRLLQPGDGGSHAVVVGGGVPLKHVLVVLAEDLAGGGDHLATQAPLPVQVAQRPQDAVDLAPGEPRARGHPELAFHVFLRIEQHAARRLPVASGAARLLKIVLQRPGDVGVDDQSDIGLVDPHAEGVRGRNDTQLALDKATLYALPALGRQPGVEVVRRYVLFLQELRHLLGLPARGAVDDSASGDIRRQVRRQDLVKMGELLAPGGRHHHELQVRALGAAVENVQIDAELVPKVTHDVLHHVGLCGCGQTQHRRDRLRACLLADEASHVAVVGSEVVPPFRQAVGLVQHPGPDLALVEHPAQRPVAKLLGRDDENARVPEPHPVEHIGPLG